MLVCVTHFLDIVKVWRNMSTLSLDMVTISLGNVNLSYDLSKYTLHIGEDGLPCICLIIVLAMRMCSNNRHYSSCTHANLYKILFSNNTLCIFIINTKYKIESRPDVLTSKTEQVDFNIWLPNCAFNLTSITAICQLNNSVWLVS
jgi:hypothetical protein